MNFQLLKLVVWPKNRSYEPRTIEFVPGQVNVITGKSRTGKSAIIPIIDYCLASSDCSIPIDTIRDHASWYGIVCQTDTEQILLARCVPSGAKVSTDCFVLRAKAISVPKQITEPNESIDGVKNILNTISSVPYFALSGEQQEGSSFGARLGFRDLMALVFQNQDIIANQNIFFYKTHAHAHRERLRNWFPFILGAETIEILQARHRLHDVEQRLRHLGREFEKAQELSSSWVSDMQGHLKVAREYGLLRQPVLPDASTDELINIAKRLVSQNPDHSGATAPEISAAAKEVAEHEKEEERICDAIGNTKKRLRELSRLKSSFEDYGNSVKKRVERLHISQWLTEISTDAHPCAFCGSEEHPISGSELSNVARAFEKYEVEAKAVEEVPSSFLREEERLATELQTLVDALKDHQGRYDIVLAKNKGAQEVFQRRKSMFQFLGHLKASLETFEKLAVGGEFQSEIARLENERKQLLQVVDRYGVQERVEIASTRISQGMFSHLKTLDVEDKYRLIPPRFKVADLNISVLSTNESWHFLAEVGSASNWVSFHIALFCALQEYFLQQKVSSVPSFVIFDQPSQVYFPKVKRGKSLDENNVLYEDDDIAAVKQMFRTIAGSVIGAKGKWQAIILDHADSSIYGELSGVVEIEEWRDGKKLIPQEWYESPVES